MTDDRKAYSLGWRAAKRNSDGALERADIRGERRAWYLGYEDYAAGRERGHQLACPNHPTCETGGN